MTWVAVAIAGGAIIGGISSSNAANTQAGAARNATDAQLQMFNRVQQNLQPYQQSGVGALNSLDYLLGIGGGGYGGGYGGGVQNGPQTPTGYAQPAPGPGPAGTAPIVNGGGPGWAAGVGGRLTNGPGVSTQPMATSPATNNPLSAFAGPNGQPIGSMGPQASPGAAQSMQTQPQQTAGPAQGGGMQGGPGAAGGLPYGYLTHQFNATDLAGNMAPNYNFQLGTGLMQAQNQAAASGGLMGGNAQQGLNAFAQNYAQNAYQQAFSNYTTNQNNIAGRLGSLAQLGQASATGSASGAPLFAQGISNTIQGMGQAQAAGQVGVGNALSGGLSNLAGYYYMNGGQSGGTAQPYLDAGSGGGGTTG